MPTTPFGLAKVILDDATVLAATSGDQVFPLARLLPSGPRSFEGLLDEWETTVEAVGAALEDPASKALGVPADSVAFLAPGVARPTIWCAGANYTDHVKEMGAPDFPKRSFHFLSPVTVLNGHREPVHRPAGVTMLDWEIELAVVIGRAAHHVAPDDALDYVAGYTVANDISVRDPDWLLHPLFGVDWTSSKNPDGFTPLGPAIVPKSFVPDPGHLDLLLSVNGEIRQKSNTSLMIVDIREQIAALSALVTLLPGDLILTGTPAGTAAGHDAHYLADGDVLVAEIAGVGSLRNTIQ